MQIYVITVFIVFLLGNLINGNQDKYEQAELRARLAKARSIEEAVFILKTSSKKGRMSIITPQALKQEQESIFRVAQELNTDSHSTIVPRNGRCEPRVICEEVPVDRASTNNIVSFPQCLEVHRCGGCCQEPQFPCVPVQEVPVTFSPLLLISLVNSEEYEVNRPLTLMNHTKCECKCNKSGDQCHREGKVLDSTLCQCIQPRCSPDCLISSTCTVVSGYDTPRCTCRRRIRGQTSNFCSNPNQRPNIMCTNCETAYG